MMALAAIASFYFLYIFLYNSNWSEAKKNEYVLTREKNIEFREGQFKNIIEFLDEKRRNFEAEYQSTKDIFQPYK